MLAQKLLEGQAYVSISLIPYMVYKIQKGLNSAISHPQSSSHVLDTAAQMLNKFNEIFGT